MVKKVEFIKSATEKVHYPTKKKFEISLIGRSNVGKSSIINKITSNRKIAKVSKSPGCTRLINFFLVNDSFYIVDLPGYGFAKVNKSLTKDWEKMIEEYLLSNRDKIVFLLVDSRKNISDKEEVMVKWLEHYKIKYVVIYTKIDKLKRNYLRDMKRKYPGIYVSSLSGEGIDEIQEILKSYE